MLHTSPGGTHLGAIPFSLNCCTSILTPPLNNCTITLNFPFSSSNLLILSSCSLTRFSNGSINAFAASVYVFTSSRLSSLIPPLSSAFTFPHCTHNETSPDTKPPRLAATIATLSQSIASIFPTPATTPSISTTIPSPVSRYSPPKTLPTPSHQAITPTSPSCNNLRKIPESSAPTPTQIPQAPPTCHASPSLNPIHPIPQPLPRPVPLSPSTHPLAQIRSSYPIYPIPPIPAMCYNIKAFLLSVPLPPPPERPRT